MESLNVLLKKGLGEVDAKYPVALEDLVEDCYPRVYGHLFPMRLLSRIYDLESFHVTIYEFLNLKFKDASNTTRDIKRFLWCFVFPDDAGGDLAYLLVSIFKSGLLKRLLLSQLWQLKLSYTVSEDIFDTFLLEHDARLERAFGGLTTALTNIQKACAFVLWSVCFWLISCVVALICKFLTYLT